MWGWILVETSSDRNLLEATRVGEPRWVPATLDVQKQAAHLLAGGCGDCIHVDA